MLPTVARVFERLIYEQLYNYFAENKLLSNEQWGFRSIRSTALALSNCSYTWTLTVDRGDISSAVFLDIKKAFDTIDHRILVNKLSQYGVCDNSLKFLSHTFLSGYSVAVSMVALVHLDILSVVCHRVPFWAHSYS